AVVDRLDRREVRPRRVEKSRSQAGDRAGPGDDRNARRPGTRLQLADPGDEGAGVGEIAIVRAAGDGRLGDAVVLPLKRSDGVDHETGPAVGDRCGWVGYVDDRRFRRIARAERLGEG